MAAKSLVRRQLSARTAAIERWSGPGDPRLAELQAELAAESLAEHIARVIDASPLSAGQRDRLVGLLHSGGSDDR